MNKKNLILFALPFIMMACGKSSSSNAPCINTPSIIKALAAEIASLSSQLSAAGITATPDTSGFFYEIINPGTGTITPNTCSTVFVTYIGSLLAPGSSPFDQNTSGISFNLGNLIVGWQKGIPLIKKGGAIKLYLPPSLAYGAAGAGSSIPPNSYLRFTINLLDVAN